MGSFAALGVGGAPVVAAFDPSSISGLVGWYKADALSLANNDPVTSFTDSSGNGNHATSSGTNRPTFKTNIVNGLPAVQFDGIENDANGMVLTTPITRSSPNAFTIAAVYAQHIAASAAHRLVSGGGANWLIGPYSGVHDLYAGSFAGGVAESQNVFVVQMVTENTTTATNYVGNVSRGTVASPAFPGQIYIGRGGAFKESAGSNLPELLIYDSVLSSTDRTNLYTHLVGKYAL